MPDIQAVYFDVDDTLWDRRGCARHALEVVLPQFMNRLPDDDVEAVIRRLNAVFLELPRAAHLRGRRGFRWLRRFEALLDSYGMDDPKLVHDLTRRFDHTRRMITRRFLRPDALELLEALGRRGIARGAIANGSPAAQRNTVESLGLSRHLDRLILAEAEGFTKPDVRLFRRALHIAGVEAEQMLYVGDSPITDVLGARRAGIPTVWLRTEHRGLPVGFPSPNHAVTELSEILSLL